MKSNTVGIPMLTIQSDWDKFIRRPVANVWLTSKTLSQNSVHKTIQFNNQKSVEGQGYDIEVETPTQLKVFCCEDQLLYRFVAPTHVFSSIHSKSISCIDVTNGRIGVSVGSDNRLRVWSSADGLVRRELVGHLFEPYFCRFFPSGEVILSGGSDMQLKIWSAITGECAVTLIGHKSAVLDSAFVDRGRNFVTVSRDGTAKLWDCSSKTCIKNLIQVEFGSALNTCALQSVPQDIDLGVESDKQLNEPVDEKGVETDGKLLVIGSESGKVFGMALNSKQKIFEQKNSCAVNSCRFITENSFVLGLQNGEIHLIDIRNTNQVLKCWETSGSPVLSLLRFKYFNNIGFFVGRSDGSAVFHYLDKDNQTFQLTGPDFEPIYSIASDANHVFTCSRDSCIRKYDIKQVFIS